jgi:hypothetical protein
MLIAGAVLAASAPAQAALMTLTGVDFDVAYESTARARAVRAHRWVKPPSTVID